MSGPRIGTNRFAGDDGGAAPQAAQALAAYAAGQGSEHDAVRALTGTRLLVPLVAAAGTGPASEMSLPTLVGQDGRPAVLAFTCVAALARWRPDARPVPTQAGDVWRAAVAEGCAVVVDVAGPAPLAVDGARLSALARGEPAPPPHQDPDVLAAVREAVARRPEVAAAGLAPGVQGSDLVLRLTLAGGLSEDQRQQAASGVAEAVLARLGGRLRRGIAVAIAAAS